MKQTIFAGLGMLLSLTTFGCGPKTGYMVKDPPEGIARSPGRYEVAMLEFRFQPESLNVKVGDTVTWVNHGKVPHTTTSGVNGKPDGIWASSHLGHNRSFSHVFVAPGKYPYYCVPHHGLGMRGVVVVTDR